MIVAFVLLIVVGFVIIWVLRQSQREKAETKQLETQKAFFKSRCLELIPALESVEESFLLWRVDEIFPDPSSNGIGEHTIELLWNGTSKMIIVKFVYLRGGESIRLAEKPKKFVELLDARWLRDFSTAMDKKLSVA